jgi:hypothetical protein
MGPKSQEEGTEDFAAFLSAEPSCLTVGFLVCSEDEEEEDDDEDEELSSPLLDEELSSSFCFFEAGTSAFGSSLILTLLVAMGWQ